MCYKNILNNNFLKLTYLNINYNLLSDNDDNDSCSLDNNNLIFK